MFGEQLLVSPILTPMDNITMLAQKTVWIPPVRATEDSYYVIELKFP